MRAASACELLEQQEGLTTEAEVAVVFAAVGAAPAAQAAVVNAFSLLLTLIDCEAVCLEVAAALA